MAFKVVWTPQATRQLAELLDYLETHFAPDACRMLLDEVMRSINYICNFPGIGVRSSSYSDVRRVQVNHKYALYYLVLSEDIILLNLFDMRADPAKNKR
jgi:plasmid stabilization system protein ParE